MKFRIASPRRITTPLLILGTLAVCLAATLIPTTSAEAATSNDFISRINSLRESKGLSPLATNTGLTTFAQGWAEKMAAAGGISHNPALGSAPGNWTTVGENVGVGGSVDAIFTALVNSSGHYANMVNTKYNAVGVGVAVGSDGRIYTTHDFAAYPGASTSKTSPKATPTTAAPKKTPAPKSAPTTTVPPAAPASSPAQPTEIPVAQQTNAPSEATQQEAATTEPQPSDRIVQGLIDVGNIVVQG